MLININRCNNIETGAVEVIEQTLNLKYAINGSGKTTIARAILASIQERLGPNKDALTALIPFKYRKDTTAKPEVSGTETIQSVRVFDENYINEFVFQADELLKGSFDIFIRNQAYEQGMREIEIQVESMQKALSEDEDVAALIGDFNEISISFGKEAKVGINGTSVIAKTFKGGNKVANIPTGLESYKSYIRHSENYKWVKWQLGGNEFINIGPDCPYCTNDIKEKRETIKRVSDFYEPKSIENLNKIVSAFKRLDKYFSDDTKARIAEFVDCMDGYTPDQANYLRIVKEEIDRLHNKFLAAQRLGFSTLKDVGEVINGLKEHKIDLTLFPHLNSESTTQKAAVVNAVIEKLLEQAGKLHGMVRKQKLLIEGLVKNHSAEINSFLLSAGYAYKVILVDTGTGQHRLKLVHHEMDGEISNVKLHLSYGERNAFALILFMYDILKSNPDLVVLDDPISSFDKNKKYAIVDMLFQRGGGSLRDKTVLLLTHDLEPVIDIVFHHHKRFKKPFATFIQNDGGVLTEKEIGRTNIKTFFEVSDVNISSDCHTLNKLIYLRRKQEVSGNKGLAFQVISNVLHKRLTPQVIEDAGTRDMTAEELHSGSAEIAEKILGFDYEIILRIVTNDQALAELYNATDSNYEKLHLYRILFEGKEFGIESNIVKKFINEAFHIENDYIYQLNPREFQTVPHFVIAQCNRYVAALLQMQNHSPALNPIAALSPSSLD